VSHSAKVLAWEKRKSFQVKFPWNTAMFVFCGILTQDFPLAKQALDNLSHTSSPFCSCYFGDGVSELFAWAGLKLTSASQVARIQV
jgi:hypothetical protein